MRFPAKTGTINAGRAAIDDAHHHHEGAFMDWRKEWFEFEDTTYLNLAGQAPMPRTSIRAAQAAIEWKKYPHQKLDSTFFEVPNRIRASVARLVGGKPEEIAITTGASTGMAAVAYGLSWKPGDEVVTAKGEFPLQYTAWKPMEEREGVKLKIVSPRERFITADDLLAAMTAKTRLVSVSLVRFDDGSLLDAARVAAACHAQGALLLLDISQCCGAMTLEPEKLGADFMVCAGYKWLLGPFGTGFFWAKSEHIGNMRPGPFYWMAVAGSDNFSALSFDDPKPAPAAKRWDTAEAASYFNFNLVAMDVSIDFVVRVGPDTVAAHNRKLIDQMYERLPKDRCVPASPLDATHRGPYGCFAARSPEKTAALYDTLRKAGVITSLRQGSIRVSPHLYNTERDIDRLISVVTA
ncbi:MAG TPA: aminotransferase class V-fold PLP-dependent enzyme [Candidatus Limnocylindria bacterium]|nr:aminotransferase class V-fold PLP-dependent enzyme [Candidatus Limnocylindria bacterium]